MVVDLLMPPFHEILERGSMFRIDAADSNGRRRAPQQYNKRWQRCVTKLSLSIRWRCSKVLALDSQVSKKILRLEDTMQPPRTRNCFLGTGISFSRDDFIPCEIVGLY